MHGLSDQPLKMRTAKRLSIILVALSSSWLAWKFRFGIPTPIPEPPSRIVAAPPSHVVASAAMGTTIPLTAGSAHSVLDAQATETHLVRILAPGGSATWTQGTPPPEVLEHFHILNGEGGVPAVAVRGSGQ